MDFPRECGLPVPILPFRTLITVRGIPYGLLAEFAILKGTFTMQRTMCKGKIHRATVTQANLNYIGSITIDLDLLEASDIYPYEKVQVVNISNGSRLETYAIAGARGSGVICLNGAAARLNSEGDIVIIISYAQYNEQEIRSLTPHIVFVDANNGISEVKHVPLNEMLAEMHSYAETEAVLF
jgi:aspartate 1-decarboxylase